MMVFLVGLNWNFPQNPRARQDVGDQELSLTVSLDEAGGGYNLVIISLEWVILPLMFQTPVQVVFKSNGMQDSHTDALFYFDRK